MAALLMAAQQAAAAPREVGPQPDTDFLEFLGSWQTGDDQTWIDPFQMDDPSEIEPHESEVLSPKDSRGQPRMKRRNSEPSTTQQEPAPRGPRRDMTP